MKQQIQWTCCIACNLKKASIQHNIELILALLMKQTERLTFTIIIILLFFSSSKTIAADEHFCTDYVLTSIEQYWRNVNQRCGFTGKRWNADYKGQYHWCLSSHQWIAENEIREREALLQTCRVNASLSVNDAFLHAINANDVEKAKQLVKKGADIRFQTQNKAVIRELGLRYQKQNQSDMTLDAKNNIRNNNTVKTKTAKRTTKPIAEPALSFAVSKGLVDVGFWLLEQQQEVLSEKQWQYYQSELLGHALITAVKQEKSDLVSDLLNKGASVDYQLDGDNGTALYFAVMQKSQKIARLLLEQQANPNYTTNAGESMLNSVMDEPSLLALLLAYKADPNSKGELVNKSSLPIMRAVETNNIKAVKLLMQHGATADIYDYDLPYPLITAIKREQIAMIRVLLKHGANMNVIYNTISPGRCVQGAENISPSSAALETKNRSIIALFTEAKSVEMLCSSVK